MWPSLFVLILLIPVLAIFLDSDLGKALAKRLERGQRDGADGAVHERMGYLEGELDRLARDVERLEEESQVPPQAPRPAPQNRLAAPRRLGRPVVASGRWQPRG